MIFYVLTLAVGVLIGCYLYPSRWFIRTVQVSYQQMMGTYREPGFSEVEVEGRVYKTRTIQDLPEEDQKAVLRAFAERHQYMQEFLYGKKKSESSIEPMKGQQ